LIQEVFDKKEKTGVTFWTFGVKHYELKENTVPYEKNAKVPNFKYNKTCHMVHFSWDMRRCTEMRQIWTQGKKHGCNKLKVTSTR
jgi:hypothetical protein